MKNAVLELMVDNMEEALTFYTNILGFEKKIALPEVDPFFVSIVNGGVEIMLYERQEFSKEIPKFKNMKLGGSIALYIEAEDIKKLYEGVKNKVVVIQEMHKTDYGSLEFSIEDNNGYVLMFNQR